MRSYSIAQGTVFNILIKHNRKEYEYIYIYVCMYVCMYV